VLRLDPNFLDAVALSVFGLQPHQYRLALAERRHDTAITTVAGVLAREVTLHKQGSTLYAESLANMLAVHLLREYAECLGDGVLSRFRNVPDPRIRALPDSESRSELPRAVSDAVAYVHANYAHDLTLTSIAQAVHMSPFHLARLFKHTLGVSPHRYLVQLRVHSARELLAAGSGGRSLAEIATAVGFAD
jgi:AraC family transcriptional regulator